MSWILNNDLVCTYDGFDMYARGIAMDKNLMKFIREYENKTKNTFFSEHELFAILFYKKPIFSIGFERARELDLDFIALHKEIRKMSPRVKDFNYFKTSTNQGAGYLWFGCFSCYGISETEREALSSQVIQQLRRILEKYNIHHELVCMPEGRRDLEFLYTAQGLYSDKDEEILKSCIKNKGSKGDVDVPEFKSVEMSIAEFLVKIQDLNRRLSQNVLDLVDYWDNHRGYKYIREEYGVIREYIRKENIDPKSRIFLGNGNNGLDAKITFPDGKELNIEVTQALPQDSHKIRQLMTKRGSLSIEHKTLYQKGKDEFPDPIVKAINRKVEKEYPDNTILLVSIMGEYSEESSPLIGLWLDVVRNRCEPGNFSHIYLVEIARSTFFDVFES